MSNYNTEKQKYKEVPLGRAKDLSGKLFGRLTAVHGVGSKDADKKIAFWLVKCECGNKNVVRAGHLVNGSTKSCGCLRDEAAGEQGKRNAVDLTGKTFGRLTALRPDKERSGSFVLWICKCSCGKETRVSSNHLRRGATQSCGCLLKERMTGENNYQYNPGLTDEDRESRSRQANKQRNWRNIVYARDDYTCLVCNRKGGRLNAHHLNGWDEYKSERFDIDNGVTLCETCHRRFHKEFGYGGNTKEQFKSHLELLEVSGQAGV